MKEGWEIRKLGEVCDFFKEQGNYTGLPYVGMEDISQFSNCFLGSVEPKAVASSTFRFDKGQVLYGRLRPYLKKILLADFAGHCSTEIFPIQTSSILLPSYLRYWFLLDSTVNKVNATCTGARMPRANMNEVLKFDIPVPPLSEQQRIVSKLDSAFEKIDALKANAENNLKNAKDLFQQVLKKELEPKDGWKEEVFENTLQKVSYTTKIKSVEYKKNGRFPVVSQEHQLISGYWDNPYDVFYISRAVVIFGDHTKEVKFVDFDFVLGADGVKILMTKPYIDSKYFYYFVKNLDIDTLGYARHYRLLKEKNVFYPSLSEQQRIVSILDSLSEKCKRLEENYRKTMAECDALKQSILREVMSEK